MYSKSYIRYFLFVKYSFYVDFCSFVVKKNWRALIGVYLDDKQEKNCPIVNKNMQCKGKA